MTLEQQVAFDVHVRSAFGSLRRFAQRAELSPEALYAWRRGARVSEATRGKLARSLGRHAARFGLNRT